MTTFILQALLNFKSFGTVAPSSTALCAGLAKPMAGLTNAKVLEVGSGDGVVAKYLLSQHKAQLSELWVNERNAILFDICKQRLPSMQHNHIDLVLKKGAFEDLQFPANHFDLVISSLPLNSLAHHDVACILEGFKQVLLTSPHASFCFYEYLGSRWLNTMHASITNKPALNSALAKTFAGYRFSSQTVLQNFPPARVWQIQPPH